MKRIQASGLRMTEEDLLRCVLDLSQRLGYLGHHCRPARKVDGSWRTPIQGTPGFCDLVLAKPGRPPLFVELKSDSGKLAPAQIKWLNAVNGLVWRPADWPERIAVELGRPR